MESTKHAGYNLDKFKILESKNNELEAALKTLINLFNRGLVPGTVGALAINKASEALNKNKIYFKASKNLKNKDNETFAFLKNESYLCIKLIPLTLLDEQGFRHELGVYEKHFNILES